MNNKQFRAHKKEYRSNSEQKQSTFEGTKKETRPNHRDIVQPNSERSSRTPDSRSLHTSSRTPDSRSSHTSSRTPDSRSLHTSSRTPDSRSSHTSSRTPDSKSPHTSNRTPGSRSLHTSNRTPDSRSLHTSSRTPDSRSLPISSTRTSQSTSPTPRSSSFSPKRRGAIPSVPSRSKYYDKEELSRLHQKTFTSTCEGLDSEGRGYVTYQGRKIPVPYLLKDEEAVIEIYAHRGKVEGKILNLAKSSPTRVASKCKAFGVCGGCQFQHMSYEDQIRFKEAYVEDMFTSLRMKSVPHLPMIKSVEPFHYRHKNQMVFGMSKKKNIISGFYEDNSHNIVNYDECLIQHPKANEITLTFKQLMKKYKLFPYDEDSKTGLIRHIFVRNGYATGQVLVVIVTASEVFPGRKGLLHDLRTAHPEITSIVQNINDRNTNMVLHEKQRVLFGDGYILDRLCDTEFQISSRSFYQVNPAQTELLYQSAIDMADLQGNEVVLDAYCGIGTIGLIAAKKAKQVIGVELNKDAFQDAVRNAKLNKCSNAIFYNADASDFMSDLATKKESIDVVFMDPPRSGSDERFIKSLEVLKPKKIVYVSCNIETLVRDLKAILSLGYELKRVQPVDLFPYTKHVEAIILMIRSGSGEKK